jgi:hypothetical protein
MKTTTILALITIVTVFGIMGTTIGTGILSQQAHASQFGSCHQLFNGLDHLNGIHGQEAKQDREVCQQFK